MTNDDIRQRRNILLCLSPSPSSIRVIRAASKLYDADRDTFSALYVGTAESEAGSGQLEKNIRFARECGAEIHIIGQGELTLTIAEFARRISATDLFIGSSAPSFLMPVKSVPEQLVGILPEVDIHIIPDAMSSSYPQTRRRMSTAAFKLRDLLAFAAVMAAATGICVLFDRSSFSNSNIVTVYILAVLIVSALTSHPTLGLLAAVLYILLFNFLFIEPRFTLLVYDPRYLVTYLVSVIAALITGSLASRLKANAGQSAENAYQAKVLLDTSTQLRKAEDGEEMIRITCRQLSELLQRPVFFYQIPDPEACAILVQYAPEEFGADSKTVLPDEKEREAILFTCRNNQHSGAFTGVSASCPLQYLSVCEHGHCYGVIGIDMLGKRFSDFEKSVLLSVLSELSLSLDNEAIRIAKASAEISAEKERFRAGLLRSVSHDLRTPLTAIYGHAGNLISSGDMLSEDERLRICTDIREDSAWLIGQMENVLSLSRLENDKNLHLSVESVEDVISESLRHLDEHAKEHDIRVNLPDEPLIARMDAKLIVLVLVNLIGNAVRYTPEGSVITITADKAQGDRILVSVTDDGPGIPDEDKEHLFEAFFTGHHRLSDSYRSMGLGLNLCYLIMQAHGQHITVRDNVPHGAVFSFTLESEEPEL